MISGLVTAPAIVQAYVGNENGERTPVDRSPDREMGHRIKPGILEVIGEGQFDQPQIVLGVIACDHREDIGMTHGKHGYKTKPEGHEDKKADEADD